MSAYTAVVGQTAPIYMYLRNDGAVPVNADGSALTMSGMTCTLIVHGADGTAISIAGSMSIENAATWLVKYSPSSGDLIDGQFRMRVRTTDGSGKIGYHPEGLWDTLTVRPQ